MTMLPAPRTTSSHSGGQDIILRTVPCTHLGQVHREQPRCVDSERAGFRHKGVAEGAAADEDGDVVFTDLVIITTARQSDQRLDVLISCQAHGSVVTACLACSG